LEKKKRNQETEILCMCHKTVAPSKLDAGARRNGRVGLAERNEEPKIEKKRGYGSGRRGREERCDNAGNWFEEGRRGSVRARIIRDVISSPVFAGAKRTK
jgi:hypothetical protein